MIRRPDWAAATEWQRLTAQWEAAAAAHDEFCRARAAAASGVGEIDQLDARIAAARKRLDELRVQMDHMVRSAGARRTGIGGEVIVATITPADVSGHDDEEEASPQRDDGSDDGPKD